MFAVKKLTLSSEFRLEELDQAEKRFYKSCKTAQATGNAIQFVSYQTDIRNSAFVAQRV